MGFLVSVLCLGLMVWVDYLVAKEMYKIAEMKGHYNKKYLWFSFWLGFVGYCMVIALPDRRKSNAVDNAVDDELPEL